MMKKLGYFFLRILGRIILLPFLMVFGFITIPLTVFFKWMGWFNLCVCFFEWCSLSEAKKLIAEGKYVFHGAQFDNRSFSSPDNNQNLSLSHDLFSSNLNNSSLSILSSTNDIYYNSSYTYHWGNIYHNFCKD